MIDKRIYFLAGLPRTGSTLLGSILSQHPDIFVTPTSPVFSMLVNVNEHFNLLSLQYSFDHVKTSTRVYHAMVEAFYGDINEPIIFDKFRGWPGRVNAVKDFLNPDPKIICTIRPIAEIITSYLVLADQDKNNFIDTHLRGLGETISNEARANLLWTTYLKAAYDAMQIGMENHRETLLLIHYRDLVERPNETLSTVYDFCGIEGYSHSLTNIENRCGEAKDEAWGLKNLHTIRPELAVQSSNPLEYLPKEAIKYFSQFDL